MDVPPPILKIEIPKITRSQFLSNVIHLKPRRKGVPWSEGDDLELLNNFNDRVPLREMAARHGRSEDAIRQRLRHLGEKPYDDGIVIRR